MSGARGIYQMMPTTWEREPFPWPLIRSTIERLHADGLHAEATRFARRASAQAEAEAVRALVRGYYPE
jgi:hypothetical protein